MDLAKVLAQLRLELENIDTAIASLERLAAQNQRGTAEAPSVPRRRGRPRKDADPAEDVRMAIEKRSGGK